MSNLMYAAGVVLALATIAVAMATPFLLAHSKTVHDHGPDCWWCHPRLLPRKRR